MIARQDNTVIKSIALLTMTFLPATFTSVRTTLLYFLSFDLCNHRRSSVRPSFLSVTMAGKLRSNCGCTGWLLFPRLFWLYSSGESGYMVQFKTSSHPTRGRNSLSEGSKRSQKKMVWPCDKQRFIEYRLTLQ